MKKFFYTTILLLFSFISKSQSINGIWKGGCEHSIFVLNPVEIILELELNNDSLISGVIHNYYKKGRYDHTKISGFINWKDSIVIIIDGEEITHNINMKLFENCSGTMQLKLTKSGNNFLLKGIWKDKNRKILHCPTLKTWFEKSIMDTLHENKNEFLTLRQTDIHKVIEIEPEETDSIKLSLYDNGEIDNDTVSVYLNDSLILKSKRLSQVPIELYLSLDKTKRIQKIKLIAENLGDIPPNTALLIVTTRKNRYSINLSSDYSKNGSVEFFLKE